MDVVSKIVKYITVIFALCAIGWGVLAGFAFMVGIQIGGGFSISQDLMPFLQNVILPLAVGGGLLLFAYTRGDVKKVKAENEEKFFSRQTEEEFSRDSIMVSNKSQNQHEGRIRNAVFTKKTKIIVIIALIIIAVAVFIFLFIQNNDVKSDSEKHLGNRYYLVNDKVHISRVISTDEPWYVPVEGADPSTFSCCVEGIHLPIAKDKNHLYYVGKIIDGADPNTIEIDPEFEHFWRDKDNYYYDTSKIPVQDINTFKPISTFYSLDSVSAYFKNKKIINSDPQMFQVYSAELAGDKNNIYTQNKILLNPQIDAVSFEYFAKGYAKDFNHVYKIESDLPRILDYLDATTFRYIGGLYVLDKNGVYYNDEKIPEADIYTFEILNTPDFAKDSQFVYRFGKVVPGAHPEEPIYSTD